MCFFFTLFHTFIFSAKDCFRPFHFRFYEGIELLRKKRKASQMTEYMTEDHAGIFIMNNEYYHSKQIFLSFH